VYRLLFGTEKKEKRLKSPTYSNKGGGKRGKGNRLPDNTLGGEKPLKAWSPNPSGVWEEGDPQSSRKKRRSCH